MTKVYDFLRYILYTIILTVGGIGNVVVIHEFRMKTSQPGTGFIIALAFTDCFTSILCPILGILQQDYLFKRSYVPHGLILCQFSWNTDAILISISIWILVSISLERLR